MNWSIKELRELSQAKGFPDQVWGPARDDDGDIIFPLRWTSRQATPDDYRRRVAGELQDWQTPEFKRQRNAYRSFMDV